MLKLYRHNDQNFIERIRENDRELLSELFIKYERMVMRYIRSNGGSEQDGQDILQEAVIVLWENALKPEFTLNAKLSTYIMAVAKNKWLAELRRKKHIAGQEEIPDVPGEDKNALDETMEREYTAQISKAMSLLSELCRQILLLYYFEQRSTKDIALKLKLANADVVKSKKYQCKQSLQQILKRMHVAAEGRA